MMAADPNRSRMSSSAASRALARARSSGSASWIAPSSSRLASATPRSVMPRLSIIGMAVASSPLAVARIVWVCAVASGRVCDRVAREKSPKRSRSVTVRQTRRAARSRRARRSTSPTRTASRSFHDLGERPSARWAPDRAPAAASPHPPGIAVVGEGVEVAARRLAQHRDERRLGELAPPAPTVTRPLSRSFPAVTGPTPHSRSTGSGWRKPSSPPGGTTSSPSGLATPLATLARNLVLATPTVIGRPTRSRTSRRSRAAISVAEPEIRSSPRTSRNASSIESPSTSGVVSLEHLEHRLARLGVRRHPRRHDHRLRAQPAGLRAAHRRPNAAGLGLVAGREHHPRPHDDRATEEPGIVSLLDRGIERVQVGVQDRGLALTRTHVRITARTATASGRLIGQNRGVSHLDHIRSYYEALNTGDVELVASHFTDDAVHYYTRLGPHRGREDRRERQLGDRQPGRAVVRTSTGSSRATRR